MPAWSKYASINDADLEQIDKIRQAVRGSDAAKAVVEALLCTAQSERDAAREGQVTALAEVEKAHRELGDTWAVSRQGREYARMVHQNNKEVYWQGVHRAREYDEEKGVWVYVVYVFAEGVF